jgi:urate oxidase
MATLGENRYGKSRVRLSRITRHADRHDFNEWTVKVLLEGDFEASFTRADNSKILPTDTMKNTVYSVARNSKSVAIEEFAMELGDYLLDNNPQVSGTLVEIEEKSWERIVVDGAPESTSFRLGGPELQTVRAVRDQGRDWSITSGIDGLVILKTTKSAFTGYIKDKLTTLKPATDRIFGTQATIKWGYAPGAAQGVRRAPQHERAAFAFRYGQSGTRSSTGNRAHQAHHAQPASSTGGPEPLRPGQPQPHLCSHRRAARIHRSHYRALISTADSQGPRGDQCLPRHREMAQ